MNKVNPHIVDHSNSRAAYDLAGSGFLRDAQMRMATPSLEREIPRSSQWFDTCCKYRTPECGDDCSAAICPQVKAYVPVSSVDKMLGADNMPMPQAMDVYSQVMASAQRELSRKEAAPTLSPRTVRSTGHSKLGESYYF